MSKMYGSYSEEDLNEWERFPWVFKVLGSSAMGAWLYRRQGNIEGQTIDRVLSIIDGYVNRRKEKIDSYEEREAYYLSAEEKAKMNAVLVVRDAVLALKGEQQS